jgi:hypothetical protein
MRTVLAIAVFAGAAFAPASSAEAARKVKRGAKPPYYATQPRYYAPRRYYAPSARSVCEERARNEDPSGQFAGYPCWAREIFGRGSGGGRGR